METNCIRNVTNLAILNLYYFYSVQLFDKFLQLLYNTIADVMFLGCMGTSKENFIIRHNKPVSENLKKDPTGLLLHDTAFEGNIKLVGKVLGRGH